MGYILPAVLRIGIEDAPEKEGEIVFAENLGTW